MSHHDVRRARELEAEVYALTRDSRQWTSAQIEAATVQLISHLEYAASETVKLWDHLKTAGYPVSLPPDPYGFWQAWSLVTRSTRLLCRAMVTLDPYLVAMLAHMQ